MKARLVPFILIIQSFLLVAHWFIYQTLLSFFPISGQFRIELAAALVMLALSFVASSALSFRSSNVLVSIFYRIAALWMGILNYVFFAAWLCWIFWFAIVLASSRAVASGYRPLIGLVFFGAAILSAIFGIVNARVVRVRRIQVKLASLPSAWQGRTAFVATDLHLGHVNGAAFSRRMVRMANGLQPDIVFIAGDLFDGSKVDAERAVAPFKQLRPPLGSFFSTGNHDEFGDAAGFLKAIAGSGIRVLASQKVLIDGLQVIGAQYHDTTSPSRFRATLAGIGIDRSVASILISHVPNHLPIAEEAGVGLQLSGHTHGGQFVPFTWLTNRIFRQFVHGLHTFGAMQVYTSHGAGTWGPPMRVGTTAEVALLTFE